MNTTKQSTIFIAVIGLAAALIMAVAGYRYLIREDFVYFTPDSPAPAQFDFASYQ